MCACPKVISVSNVATNNINGNYFKSILMDQNNNKNFGRASLKI